MKRPWNHARVRTPGWTVAALLLLAAPALTAEDAIKTEKAAGTDQDKAQVLFQQAGNVPVNTPIPLSLKDGTGLKIAFLAKGQNDAQIVLHDKTSGKDLTPTGVKWSGGNSADYNYGHNDFAPVLYCVASMGYGSHANEDQELAKHSPAVAAAEYSSLSINGNSLQVSNLVFYRGDDTTPPAAPANLAAKLEQDGVHLSWNAATDNAAVSWYAIARADGNGKFVKIGQTANLAYVDKPPAAGACRYRVLAVDFERNIGSWSNVATVQLGQGFAPPDEAVLAFKYPWLGNVQVTFVDRKKMREDSRNYGAHIRAVYEAGRGTVKRGRVLFIGDGCTHTDRFGWGGGTSACNKILTLFPCCWVNDGGSWDPQNERTDPFLLKCLPEELKKKPELCVLTMGINSPHGTPEERQKVVDDVLAMVRMCEAAGAVAVVGTTTAYSWADPVGSPEEALSDALARMCEEQRIPVIRIFDLYRNAQTAGANYKALMGGPNGGRYAPGASFPQNELFYPSFEEGMHARYKIMREYLDQVLFTLLDRPDPETVFPNAPRKLVGAPQANNKIQLTWEAPLPASDGTVAEAYAISRNGTVIATVAATAYLDQGLDESTRCTYAIRALDRQLNASAATAEGAWTTLADTTPPAVIGIKQVDRSCIRVLFDEKVEGASALATANYQIEKGVSVTNAVLDSGGTSVTLTAHGWAPLTYTIRIVGIKDASAAHNTLAGTASFTFEFHLDATVLSDGWVRMDDNSPYLSHPVNAGQVYVLFDKNQYKNTLHCLSTSYGGWSSFTFTGTGVRWIGNKQSNQGLADVYIDNVRVATALDTYAATPEYQAVLFEKKDLPLGSHTIKVSATGKKNPAASNTLVTLDAFDYAPNASPAAPGGAGAHP